MVVQPRSQGLSSSRPREPGRKRGKTRDPRNEVNGHTVIAVVVVLLVFLLLVWLHEILTKG